MAVKPEFIINLKNKQFVMLGGLLDLAHDMGLMSIQTEIDEKYSIPEKEFWVMRATGIFQRNGEAGVWSAIGDACPGNSQMRGAYLRHAETRAVARMLRLATNCATTAFEELGPDIDAVNMPGNPPVEDYQCETCQCDIELKWARHSERQYAGHRYCAKCAENLPVAKPPSTSKASRWPQPPANATKAVVAQVIAEEKADALAEEASKGVTEVLCSSKGCGQYLTQEELAGCAKRADQLGGKVYCTAHGKAALANTKAAVSAAA